MGKAFLGPLSQLQVADFEELRSYRVPPESVVRVTDALCDLFHCETGWASAKQLLCTEDFYQVGNVEHNGGGEQRHKGQTWQREAVRVRSRAPVSAPTPLNTFSQELVFFPKEKMTDSEMIKLAQALKAPGMSDAALRAVSIPAASLAAWLWAVLRYGLAQRRGLPTGLLLRQIEGTLAREQALLGHRQFQAQETLEHKLDVANKLEDSWVSHNRVMENLIRAQCGQYHKWPIKSALLTPMQSWTTELQVTSSCPGLPPKLISVPLTPTTLLLPAPSLPPFVPLPSLPCFPAYPASHPLYQTLSACTLLTGLHALCSSLPHQKLKGHCTTMFGDALLCSAAIIYLGPFPALRRQELLDKWLALCRGFQEPLGPDDVAQALKQKQKSAIMPPKNPLLSTRSPFNLLTLLSSKSEQFQWDRDLKPQAKSARLAGLLLRSHTHYSSFRWPLLLDPSNQAPIWLNPLPLQETRCLAPGPGKVQI